MKNETRAAECSVLEGYFLKTLIHTSTVASSRASPDGCQQCHRAAQEKTRSDLHEKDQQVGTRKACSDICCQNSCRKNCGIQNDRGKERMKG